MAKSFVKKIVNISRIALAHNPAVAPYQTTIPL
jgi:hypothetical protein